jgi:hypothetical protein
LVINRVLFAITNICIDLDIFDPVTSPNLEAPPIKLPSEAVLNQTFCQQKESLQKENGEMGRLKMQQFSKCESANSSAIHPMRIMEDENLDYDSNASSSSFEFHKGERSVHNPFARSLSRPMPSKWNDAEKWIMNRQNAPVHYSKKNSSQNQSNRLPMTNIVRVAPESASYDHKLMISRTAETKRVDFCQPALHVGHEKFSFVPSGSHPVSDQAHGDTALTNLCPLSEDLKGVDHSDLSSTECSTENMTGISKPSSCLY